MSSLNHQLSEQDKANALEEIHTIWISSQAVPSHGRKALSCELQLSGELRYYVTRTKPLPNGRDIVYSGKSFDDAIKAYNDIS